MAGVGGRPSLATSQLAGTEARPTDLFSYKVANKWLFPCRGGPMCPPLPGGRTCRCAPKISPLLIATWHQLSRAKRGGPSSMSDDTSIGKKIANGIWGRERRWKGINKTPGWRSPCDRRKLGMRLMPLSCKFPHFFLAG